MLMYGIFAYGKDKPGMFHSEKFIEYISKSKLCKVEEFECDHWITVNKGKEVLKSIKFFKKYRLNENII